MQQVHWLLGIVTGAVALVELVPFTDLIVVVLLEATGSDYWKQAQDEALREIFAVTLLKKKRLLQSQFTEPLTVLSQTQLDASRPTGQICLVCMY